MTIEIDWAGQPDVRRTSIEAAASAMDGRDPLPARLATIEQFRAELADDDTVANVREDGPVTVAQIARVASSPPKACRFLHTLTAQHDPSTVIEMGTAVGISAAYIAAGLRSGAHMWTIDIREVSARYASDIFERLGVDNVEVVIGRFQDVLDDVLTAAAPVDLVFVDGHHREQPTIDYTDQVWPHLSARALVVYDDIGWSDGMKRAWQAIRGQQRWTFTADLGRWGVCAV